MAARELGMPGGNPLGRARSGGGGASAMTTYTEVFITSGSGIYTPPAGFNAMRVTAVGAGASGTTGGAYGGAGGGCAQSVVSTPAAITYSIGIGGVAGVWDGSSVIPPVPGSNTTASFGAVSLVASASSDGTTGGTASGGLTNYAGGSNGGNSGGGGAGGTTSAGGNGNATSSGNGGGGGAVGTTGTTGGGGGGIGAHGGSDGSFFGKEPNKMAWGSVASGRTGGWPGGGGGSGGNNAGGNGAAGGIRIELW